MILNEVINSQEFSKPVALHAACGLLENKGIYIVGGRESTYDNITN